MKSLSVDDGSDSDSDGYVGPLELNHAVKMSYVEGHKQDKQLDDESEHTDEYDYPYMEGVTHMFSDIKSAPSQAGYQNVPTKAVRHNRVHLPKSASFDSDSSPDFNTNTKRHELLSGSRPAKGQVVRASSQAEILEPLVEGENYIKMNPKEANAMVKSHSYNDSRTLHSISDQSGTPGTSSVNSQMEQNYKGINRLTIATDGMYVHTVYEYIHNLW